MIALVITIIVLLILAGIAIATLMGENGILTKTNEAKTKTDRETAKERVQIEVMGSYGTDGKIDIDLLNANLKTIEGLTHGGKNLDENPIKTLPTTVELDGFTIEIDDKGKVNIKDQNSTEEGKTGVYAKLYTRKNSEEEVLVLASKESSFPDYSGELNIKKDIGKVKEKITYEDIFIDPEFESYKEYLESDEWKEYEKENPELAKEAIEDLITNLQDYRPWLEDDVYIGSIGYRGNRKLCEVRIVDEIFPTKTNKYFEATSVSKIEGIENLNTSNVTDMSNMFSACTKLTSLNLQSFDTSNVTDMSDMFFECGLTSLDLQSFDTSNVTNMNRMFSRCNNLTSLNLQSFDTSNVTDMSDMFLECAKLTSLNLQSFDTSNVTDMSDMFFNCGLTSLDLQSFDTSNVTNMSNMFSRCNKLTSLNLQSFDTSNVTDMSNMFSQCYELTNLNLQSFDTSNVTNMSSMFYNCGKLTSLNLQSFDTSKVTDMGWMFAHCKTLTEILVGKNWVIQEGTDTIYMFSECGVSNVTKK